MHTPHGPFSYISRWASYIQNETRRWAEARRRFGPQVPALVKLLRLFGVA